MKYRTTAAYISGGICGRMWMPQVMAGNLIKKDLRGPWGFYAKGDTFLEALRSLILREGGDFQIALFTADTVIRIERRRSDGPGKYSVHVREIPVSKLASDYTDQETETVDVMGDDY